MDDLQSKRTDVLLEEYKALKDEQKARIGFRDNLLYVNLAAAGGVGALSISKEGPLAALLVIPWIGVILGWTYVVNDQKISAIGQYLRRELQPEIKTLIDGNDQVWKWETHHRSDDLRVERKFVQLFIDLLTFCGAGAAAIATYWVRETNPPAGAYLIGGLEAILLLFLMIQILTYFDWKKSR